MAPDFMHNEFKNEYKFHSPPPSQILFQRQSLLSQKEFPNGKDNEVEKNT